jgi:probable phosphoglycerate mutase
MNSTEINFIDDLRQNMASRIYLIRHGQTQFNVEHRIQGQLDIPLNQQGFSQAKFLHRHLARTDFDRAFSSPLIRAKTTAESILGARHRHLELTLLPELQELYQGDWEGRLESELRLLDELDLWKTNPLACNLPGESMLELEKRVIPAWEKLVQECVEYRCRNVLVVSHKFVIQVILCHIHGLNLQHFSDFPQDNCAINIIDYQSNGVAELKITNLNVLESRPLAV